MDLNLVKEIVILFLFFIVLFCVFVPIKFASTANESGVDIFHSDRYASVVSILNCFAAGIFLGTCLLHLFPDVTDNVKQALENIDPQGKYSFPFGEFCIAMGFFVLLTIEQIIADVRDRNFALSRPETLPILSESMTEGQEGVAAPTEIVNRSLRAFSLTGALVLHSLFEGLTIGVQSTIENVLQITGALILHKIVISFSLGLTLSQSPLGTIKSAICGIFFAASSPVGVGIGLLLTDLEALNGSLAIGALQGVAAGSFLFVLFMEILPNEFRSGHLHLPKLLSFIVGFGTITFLIFLFPD